MASDHGGRVTLRRASASALAVEYEGELTMNAQRWPVRVRVDLALGGVTWISGDEPASPAWLVAFLRATLRAAWRSSRAGQPWPRRMNRWKKGDSTDEAEAQQR